MEARTDRRAPEVPRIPLDVLVQLSHEDFEEPFDADGVDVSSGGLALRSDYLPEIGDRLRCRFDCPPDGLPIEMDGEVVWAHDAGERSGEFGMRFTELDTEAEEALQRLLAHIGGAPMARTDQSLVRLHLDKVATPIEAEVIERSDGWITVEQELPFLKIGMGVAVEGLGPAHGRLASVDLRIEGGTPRLLLVVEHGGVRQPAPMVDGEATLTDFEAPRSTAIGGFAAAEDERDVFTPADLDVAPEPRAVWQDLLDKARARGTALVLAAIASARPKIILAWAALAAFAQKVAEKGGPRVKLVGMRVAAVSRGLFGRVVAKTKGKRRTTAAPVRVAMAPPKRRMQREEIDPPSPKRTRRIAIVSLIAFAGVGAAVYVFAQDDEAPPAPVVVAAPPPAPVAPPAPPVVAPPVVAATPVIAAPAAPEAPVVEPSALPAPEAEAGQLGEPTYPSLREAAQREAPAGPAGHSFGADSVPHGRAATIRMSQPVTEVRGHREPDGFTVTVPGALALDRAGPIAQANPSVERAMILNRGDHSVLTVRFVAGRTPPYRVVARGNAIEVVIGR